MSALVRQPSSIVWELRAAWATGRRVALSGTGAHVPVDAILAVHLPSRLGDSDATRAFHGRARRIVPQEEELPL